MSIEYSYSYRTITNLFKYCILIAKHPLSNPGTIMPGTCTICSLVPRPLPVFKFCTLKVRRGPGDEAIQHVHVVTFLLHVHVHVYLIILEPSLQHIQLQTSAYIRTCTMYMFLCTCMILAVFSPDLYIRWVHLVSS